MDQNKQTRVNDGLHVDQDASLANCGDKAEEVVYARSSDKFPERKTQRNRKLMLPWI